MFLPGCDAILDSSIWGHARYVYVSNLCLLYLCVNIKTFVEIPDVQLEEMRQATTLDSSLQDVIQFVMEGWPEEKL